jgi:hypothetical protein
MAASNERLGHLSHAFRVVTAITKFENKAPNALEMPAHQLETWRLKSAAHTIIRRPILHQLALRRRVKLVTFRH